MPDLFVHRRDRRAARTYFAAAQRSRCAICDTPSNALCLDHEHSDEKLCRGLLCSNCNTALGLFADDPARLTAAAAYLEAHAERNERYRQTEDWRERSLKVGARPLTDDERERRNLRIVLAFESGSSTKRLAEQFGLSISHVNRVISA